MKLFNGFFVYCVIPLCHESSSCFLSRENHPYFNRTGQKSC